MLVVCKRPVLYGFVMIIACPECATRYVVPDNAIGIEGRTVRCAKCRHSWFQEGPRMETAATPPEPVPASAEPEPVAPRANAEPPAQETEAEPPAPPPPVAESETQATVHEEPAEETEESQPEAQAEAEPQPETEAPAETAPEETLSEPPLAEPPEERDPVGYYDDAEAIQYGEAADERSSFEYAPPFRPRLNRPKLLMIAAVVFAVVALGLTAYIDRYGLPNLGLVRTNTFAQAQPDLVLDFPPSRQDRRTLPNGTEFFGASGTVTNVGKTERSVPSILIVMRDARDRIVYSWEVVPPKRRLGPGESVTINEAVTDVPKSATAAEIGWKPG